jgi:ParB-like chromosome segregation protein Spo0J
MTCTRDIRDSKQLLIGNRQFDEKTLGELVASFKTQGGLEPLQVRPLEESKFEVVIGARKLEAARLAELESVAVPMPRPLRPRWSRTCNARTSTH